MDGFKGDEKLGFDDIVNMNLDKSFKLLTIRPFQDIKIPNVERLNKMRWMRKKVKGDDVLLFVEFFELDWEMAFIAI